MNKNNPILIASGDLSEGKTVLIERLKAEHSDLIVMDNSKDSRHYTDEFLKHFEEGVEQYKRTIELVAMQELNMLPSGEKRGTLIDVRTEAKIGRNEPCPCNSGKKYKKCCIGKPIQESQTTQIDLETDSLNKEF